MKSHTEHVHSGPHLAGETAGLALMRARRDGRVREAAARQTAPSHETDLHVEEFGTRRGTWLIGVLEIISE